MKNYLTKVLNWQTDDIASQYDELPMWSAPFGMLLMDNFPMGDYAHYLDIGMGTGFPLIDIAQRLGDGCKSVGIDPWKAAMKRTRFKIEALGLNNIELIEADASVIPFPKNHFDLITSNLGINNFENPLQVLKECYRVLKDDAPICITTNLTGTFSEFYAIYNQTLIELGLLEYCGKLEEHIRHRGTVESVGDLMKEAGFKITKQIVSKSEMRFFNGTAFLNHTFILIGFIDSWRNMFDEKDKVLFFDRFEKNLNDYSKHNGELRLTVPMAYFECRK